MEIKTMPGSWKAVTENGVFVIRDRDGRKLAVIEPVADMESIASLMTTSPFMLEALKALVALIGDEDLEDNGELSGAAVCDLAREAVSLAEGVSG